MIATVLTLEEVKRRTVIDALDRCHGHFGLAATSLGIGKSTLYRLAHEYGYKYQSVAARAESERKP